MNPLLRKILDSSRENPISEEELKELESSYPAFTLPDLMAVKSRTATAEEAARVAISLPDADSYRYITGEDAGLFANFYPEPQSATPSTMETIDTFLATYGTPGNKKEMDILEKTIFNPVADMGAVLMAEEKDSVPEGDELNDEVVGTETAAINRFIATSKGRTVLPATEGETPQASPSETPTSKIQSKKQEEPQTEKVPADDEKGKGTEGDLSESFARIMIKNHNYIKALEIISDLNLKNPEKSIYFADQIRFLRKLIVNEKKKQ